VTVRERKNSLLMSKQNKSSSMERAHIRDKVRDEVSHRNYSQAPLCLLRKVYKTESFRCQNSDTRL
jgi:hypothetical protein